jgi:peptidyl-prolyl cis-trans isomerase C
MQQKALAAALLAAVVTAGVAVAQEQPAQQPADLNPKVMTVNGQPVYAAEISLMMQNIQGYLTSQGQEATEDQIAQVATRRVVEQKLLAQEAARFSVKPDEQRIAQMMELTERQAGGSENLKKMLAQGGSDTTQLEQIFREMELGRSFIAQQVQPTIEVSDQEITNFYNENPDQFVSEEQVRARHILFKAEPDADEATQQAARAKAEQARERAAAGGADFAELATELSEGPSGPNGGDLGFFTREQMVPAFSEAAFALEPGQISPVVQTRFGYHVIKVEERREAGPVPLDEAREPIRRMLTNEKTNVAVGQLMRNLAENADVQFLDENGQPLPQQPPPEAAGSGEPVTPPAS